MSTVLFIGPGLMGAPMIANLVRAGHDVRAIGRSEASRQRAVDAGAELCDDLATAVAGREFVITILPDTPDVEAIVLGEGGLAELMEPGQVFIDMSTISASSSRRMHDALAAKGVAALDCPVSGGEQGAIGGVLTVMAGGDAEALERARPVLEAMSSRITHVGPAGSGQLTKAANQIIVAANIQAVAEAVVLLERTGVEIEPALNALAGGFAGSAVMEAKRKAFLHGDFTPGFRTELHNKDLRIVAAAVAENRLALPLNALVTQLLAAVEARGDGALDDSALLKLTRDLNGG
ncbi:MAG TPA: NAD(P)-dependent oxidoreductase [Arachnia sp.]|jgi:2-hydroxy-3-oxopropionate reductase|nr:NAD(P)-dependent oxidoreductase [Arachnia sp.]